MSEPTKIEYQVRPVTRYTVTRYEEHADGCGHATEKGTFDNEHIAHEVGYALAKDEHERLGWLPGDERIQYPRYNPPSTFCQSGEATTA